MTLDSKYFRAAQPVRAAAAMAEMSEAFWAHLDPKTREFLQTAWRDDSTLTGTGIAEAIEQFDDDGVLETMLLGGAQLRGGAEMGHAYATFLPLRQMLKPAAHFLVEDSIVEMLAQTDLGGDVPMGVLKLPFPRMYLELGRGRDTGLKLYNELSGWHELEGAYLESGRRADGRPGMYLMMTGSGLGKENPMDDATRGVFLATEDPLISVEQALHDSFEEGDRISKAHGLVSGKDHEQGETIQALLLVVKALLYLNSVAVRKTLRPERSEWELSHALLKSPAKKEKARRRAGTLYDHILIEPPVEPRRPAGLTAEGARWTVGRHWKRGHFKMQPHGPANSERKLIFRAPMLVHPELGAPDRAPSYVAR